MHWMGDLPTCFCVRLRTLIIAWIIIVAVRTGRFFNILWHIWASGRCVLRVAGGAAWFPLTAVDGGTFTIPHSCMYTAGRPRPRRRATAPPDLPSTTRRCASQRGPCTLRFGLLLAFIVPYQDGISRLTRPRCCARHGNLRIYHSFY